MIWKNSLTLQKIWSFYTLEDELQKNKYLSNQFARVNVKWCRWVDVACGIQKEKWYKFILICIFSKNLGLIFGEVSFRIINYRSNCKIWHLIFFTNDAFWSKIPIHLKSLKLLSSLWSLGIFWCDIFFKISRTGFWWVGSGEWRVRLTQAPWTTWKSCRSAIKHSTRYSSYKILYWGSVFQPRLRDHQNKLVWFWNFGVFWGNFDGLSGGCGKHVTYTYIQE